MVKNDFPWDVNTLCHKEGLSQATLSKEMGLSRNAINKRARSCVITPGFVEAIEKIGYDIEVHYIKRNKNED